MSREMKKIRRASGWAATIAALALAAGCAGGVDEDRQRNPNFVPPNVPINAGRISLEIERERIPADGTTIVEVVANVSDAQGRPLADTFVVFTSEFEDVTWLTAQRIPTFALSPAGIFGIAECGEFTNENGRASCLMRSSYTEGSTQLRAEAVDVGLRDTRSIEFTFSGGGPGLALALDCEDTDISAEELPRSTRVTATVTQAVPSATGDNEVRPAAGVDVFFSTSNGQFENGRDEITLRTDALGTVRVDLRFSQSARDSSATVLAGTSGALPASCGISIGDFLPPTAVLTTLPGSVTAGNPDKQVIAVAVQLTPPPQAVNSTVSFSSPVGTFSPSTAGVQGNSGFAETLWTITSAESNQLVSGIQIPVVFGVDYGAIVPLTGSEPIAVIDFVREPDEEETEEEPVEVIE